MEDSPPQQQPRQRGLLLIFVGGVLAVIAAVIVIALLVFGGGDDNSSDVGDGNVAKIETAGPITKAKFNRWYAFFTRSSVLSGDRSKVPIPPLDSTQGQAIKNRTMEFLITDAWIAAEAKQKGVTASDAEVRRFLALTKRKSFPKPGDFRKYMRQSGQSQQDLLFRMRQSVLASKLGVGQTGAQNAFRNKWRERTVCAAAYVVPSCGNS